MPSNAFLAHRPMPHQYRASRVMMPKAHRFSRSSYCASRGLYAAQRMRGGRGWALPDVGRRSNSATALLRSEPLAPPLLALGALIAPFFRIGFTSHQPPKFCDATMSGN
jgi:hypothetical protein